MINTIIFDFGDVLIRDTTKTLEKKFRFDKLLKKKQLEYIRAFHQTEKGKAPVSRLLNTISSVLTPHLSPKEVESFVLNSEVMPPWNMAKKLSKHYRIIIFSNNQKGWPKKFCKILRTDFFIFPFINSADVGYRKPQKIFYKYLFKKYELDPQKCIFVDDKEKNLVPARAFGVKTFRYENNLKELKAFFKKLGIEIY